MAARGDQQRTFNKGAIVHDELSLAAENNLLSVNFSTTTSVAIRLPPGHTLYGLIAPTQSVRANIRLTVCESVSGTYRTLRKSDGTGVWDPMNGTSTSALGAIWIPDLAPFKFMKIYLGEGFGQKYRWRIITKG